VLEGVAIAVVVVLLAAMLTVWLIRRENAGLRRAARRYRELELEGIEELRRDDDAYPEYRRVEGAWMREPDGRRADADRVLHDELVRAREHTRRMRRARSTRRSITRAKGAECLL
jgi:type II secretory pathway pseudopilin PulG